MSEQHKTHAAGLPERVARRERGPLTRRGGLTQSIPRGVTWIRESIIVLTVCTRPRRIERSAEAASPESPAMGSNQSGAANAACPRAPV